MRYLIKVNEGAAMMLRGKPFHSLGQQLQVLNSSLLRGVMGGHQTGLLMTLTASGNIALLVTVIIRFNSQVLLESYDTDFDVTRVALVGAKTEKTEVVKNSRSPVWNEQFEVFVGSHATYIALVPVVPLYSKDSISPQLVCEFVSLTATACHYLSSIFSCTMCCLIWLQYDKVVCSAW